MSILLYSLNFIRVFHAQYPEQRCHAVLAHILYPFDLAFRIGHRDRTSPCLAVSALPHGCIFRCDKTASLNTTWLLPLGEVRSGCISNRRWNDVVVFGDLCQDLLGHVLVLGKHFAFSRNFCNLISYQNTVHNGEYLYSDSQAYACKLVPCCNIFI